MKHGVDSLSVKLNGLGGKGGLRQEKVEEELQPQMEHEINQFKAKLVFAAEIGDE